MTAHINASIEDIATNVIMPGDPLRAKYIAENYLTDYKLVSDVRNNLIYTGYYKDKRITIASSGMGMASMGIYCYELYNTYNVEQIIRVGSCGSFFEEIKLYDIILVEKAYTLSNFAFQYNGINKNIIQGSPYLGQKLVDYAYRHNINVRIGNINTTDIFYSDHNDPGRKDNYCLGVEMECFALFYIANSLRKQAAAVLTVSDNLATGKELDSEDRENKFDEAIILALEAI